MEENARTQQEEWIPNEQALLEQKSFDDKDHYHRYSILLSPITTLGYHQFKLISSTGESAAMCLIVAPKQCYQPAKPPDSDPEKISDKNWGIALQLYALRSQRNWGIGDFTDLKKATNFFAALGADAIGLNPLHALFPHNPKHKSPYSPSSRLFLNPLYLDIEAIADCAECESVQTLLQNPEFQQRLQKLRSSEWVDYEQVAAAKFTVLQQLYQHFRNQHLQNSKTSIRAEAFRQYQQDRGRTFLRYQALYDALQSYFHDLDPAVWGWSTWLPSYQTPHSELVNQFAEAHQEQVEFYEYLQWQSEWQLQQASEYAQQQGMNIGLYCDLAVGVNSDGAETWANPSLFALNARVGAPPDDFSPKGQDWGLPPLIPEQLQETAYELFINTLRSNMRYAGALRIDHVMGLLRLFWIPSTQNPANGTADGTADGTYISYPVADLTGILALESQRNRCLVIGEDLGTVPDELRHTLYELGVLSYRVLYFEKDWQANTFKLPGEYPNQALATASTHDLPTLRGFWQAHDLQLRDQLDLFPTPDIRDQQYAARQHDRLQLLLALEREDLLPTETIIEDALQTELSEALLQALQIYLARSPSQLMMLQLEDVLGQIAQVNLPGTVDQYPNWQHKMHSPLEAWQDDQTLRSFALAIDEARKE